MSYNPATDFFGLLRLVGSSVRSLRMPAVDLLTEALNRMGMFNLSVGQTAPTVNQATTMWLKPASPSWSAEGVLYIWNPVSQEYEQATAALWHAFFTPSDLVFQSLPAANNIITAGVSTAAVQRAAPANTGVQLPRIADQFLTERDIMLVDYSTGIVGTHTITVSTPDGAKIMQQNTWNFLSTPDNLAGVRLRPSPDLNAWIFAP